MDKDAEFPFFFPEGSPFITGILTTLYREAYTSISCVFNVVIMNSFKLNLQLNGAVIKEWKLWISISGQVSCLALNLLLLY